ncbi:MAG: universal stress protein [Phaeodactylibacter sp.]|uniref:universal stress protein n=1 Tax=Phaeodactylibacter sp. TaxID=1940289 RepID=UPI0032EC0656
MKNLLIPVDFSDASRNAFQYAMALAKHIGAEKAKLVHVFLPESSGEADFIPPVHAIMESRHELLNDFLNDLAADNAGSLPVEVQTELLVGFPADEIASISEGFDLIVMGTTGDGGVLERIFGSVSSSVSQRAACPVLLIPKDVTFSPIRHMVYASHYDAHHETVVKKLMAFNSLFNAHLHFVHVQRHKDLPFVAEQGKLFEELFEKGNPRFAFEMAEVKDESVVEGLSEYAASHHAQVIVMATRHRGFWDNILHSSQTKKMVLAAETPLLILHLDME